MKTNKTFEGMLLGEGLKFGIVVARFNDFITNKLLEGAQDALLRHGVNEEDIESPGCRVLRDSSNSPETGQYQTI